jgi:hypothetical protein
MSTTFTLRPGQSFSYDGELCTVTEILNGAIVIRDNSGHIRRLRVVDVLLPADEGGLAHFPGHARDEPNGVPPSVLWTDATDAAAAAAHERADHVREVLTGYRSGSELVRRADEPRSAYAQDRTLMARQRAKAKELNVGLRSVQRWIAQYQQGGETGLVDARTQPSGVFSRLDPRWVTTAQKILEEQRDEPKVGKGAHRNPECRWGLNPPASSSDLAM